MTTLFLEAFAKPLLVAHAVASVVLMGSATHQGLLSLRALLGGRTRRRLQALYAVVTLWALAVTHGLGLLLYPTFRVRVRAADFDVSLRLATGFFEVKEHWGALGLMLAVFLMWTRARLDDAPRADQRLFDVAATCLMVIVWWMALTGFVLTALHPV